jgi:hypothetical protein
MPSDELAWPNFNCRAPSPSAEINISPAEHKHTSLRRGLSIEAPRVAKFLFITRGGSTWMAESYLRNFCHAQIDPLSPHSSDEVAFLSALAVVLG